jgi:hypothetical protein
VKILFVLDGLGAGNAYIRGILPSRGIKSIKTDYVDASDFNPSTVSKEDTVVFVKYDKLNKSSLVKKTGAKVVLDVVDSKKHWMQHRGNLDALIVNTKSSELIIRNRFNFEKPIFKIPHILTNFSKDLLSQERKQLPERPRTIGYMGVNETFSDPQEFQKFAESNNMRWYQSSPNIHTNESLTKELDLGCIYFDERKERIGGTLTMTKPSAKLLNLFSYGIPALFTPYESYVDAVIGNELLSWCICASKEAMFDKVKIIYENPSLYKALSKESFNLSKKYHISNADSIYNDLLNFVRS